MWRVPPRASALMPGSSVAWVDDGAGDEALADLHRFGVRTEGVTRTEAPTTTALVLLSTGGDRAIISEPIVFDYEPLRETLDTLSEGQRACLHVDGYRIPEALPLLREARENGILTSADLDGLDPEALSSTLAIHAA